MNSGGHPSPGKNRAAARLLFRGADASSEKGGDELYAFSPVFCASTEIRLLRRDST